MIVSRRPYQQKGIALIQVLLITAVLSILALYLSSTAKDQVKMAQWADDKALALIAVQSAEAQLFFNLLTESKVQSQENNLTDNIPSRWNFFANPFKVSEQVTTKIQDQSALIHAHFPDPNLLKSLLAFQGLPINEVSRIYDNLLDWQDLDNIPRNSGDELLSTPTAIRNGAVPDLHDFSFVPKITADLQQSLLKNTTLYSKGFFNAMDAPEELLAAITSVEQAKQIVQLREAGQLSNVQFSQLSGIVENEKVLFYPSNILAIEFEGKVGMSVVRKQITVELTPYANQYQTPINIFSNRG